MACRQYCRDLHEGRNATANVNLCVVRVARRKRFYKQFHASSGSSHGTRSRSARYQPANRYHERRRQTWASVAARYFGYWEFQFRSSSFWRCSGTTDCPLAVTPAKRDTSASANEDEKYKGEKNGKQQSKVGIPTLRGRERHPAQQYRRVGLVKRR
jgi:hypothetical protein